MLEGYYAKRHNDGHISQLAVIQIAKGLVNVGFEGSNQDLKSLTIPVYAGLDHRLSQADDQNVNSFVSEGCKSHDNSNQNQIELSHFSSECNNKNECCNNLLLFDNNNNKQVMHINNTEYTADNTPNSTYLGTQDLSNSCKFTEISLSDSIEVSGGEVGRQIPGEIVTLNCISLGGG